jgi:SAM-dependent methyltransferase
VGVYGDHVLPRIIDVVCNMKVAVEQRERVCDGLAGEVVEIGFGSGSNVPFYPDAVTRVAAVEPADVGWKLAAKRLRDARVPVERSGLDGASLPFPDDAFDAALSTWTMCTIPDLDAALRELRRVLKPGGKLHFVEHRPGSRREGASLAAPARAGPEARVRRLPSDPADGRAAPGRRLRDHRGRPLLREGLPEGLRGELARRRALALGVRQRRSGPTGVVVDRVGRRTNPKGILLGFPRVRVAIRRSVHGRNRACRGSSMGS